MGVSSSKGEGTVGERTITRLAIICFEDPRHVTGGVQRRIAAEVAFFSEHGARVTVICEGKGEASEEGNVRYVTVPTPAIIYPLRTMLFSARAARLLRGMPRFDLVETHHDAGAAGLLASRRMKRDGATWVEVVHGVFSDEFACVRRHAGILSRGTLAASGLLPLSVVEGWAARRADAVVAVSDYAARQIVRRYRVPRRRIEVLPNGIETARYSPGAGRATKPEGDCEIVYVGRWHARKGVPQLLHAFAIATTALPAPRLTLIGGGPLEASLREDAARLGIAERVTFRSGLSDEEIVEAYRAADIVCVPSLQEGQGIVALEAQACGAPVVATRAGGLAEAVVEGVTGLVVEPGDVPALAEALAGMASDSEARRDYGMRASEWACRFAWPLMLSRVEGFYGRLHYGKAHGHGTIVSLESGHSPAHRGTFAR